LLLRNARKPKKNYYLVKILNEKNNYYSMHKNIQNKLPIYFSMFLMNKQINYYEM